MTDKPTSMVLMDPRSNLACGFADFIRRLSTKLGAPPDAAFLAGEASRATMAALSEGNVCSDIRTLAKSLGKTKEDVRALLFNSKITASDREDHKLPLVCDEQGRIFLYRYYDYERQLANAVSLRIPSAGSQPLQPEVRKFLDEHFAENEKRLAGRPDRQKIAVMKALASPLTIVSGGPGTGKTTIVSALIAALVLNDPAMRIALTAPTGKAAARMEDTIRKQMSMLSADWIKQMPNRALTLHMLLGARPENGSFRFNRDHPLPYDVVVVDEASMIDLSLAAHLFSALSPDAKVVLLGDKDQLASVEAGAVFAELALQSSMYLHEPPGVSEGISDCVVWLTDNYRFDAESPIGNMARLVIEGKDMELAKWIQSQNSDVMKWENVEGGLPAKVLDEWVDGYKTYVEAVHLGDPGNIFRAYKNFCILCAIRQGRRGVKGVNEVVAQKLRLKLERGRSGDSLWYPGRPVMITENDYVHEIFNGDIGIALADEDGNYEIWFEKKQGGMHRVAPSMLPAHETAFATTVHKAQGSEFEKVALVLPEHDVPVLTRELIYTAVTRARKSLALYGSTKILAAAVARPTIRQGALADRIHALQLKKN